MSRFIGFMIILILCSALFLTYVPLSRALETVFIQSDGSIYPSMVPIQRNGDVYQITSNIVFEGMGIVVQKSGIVLDGLGNSLHGSGSLIGVKIDNADNLIVKNLRISSFDLGIEVSGSNNLLCDNEILMNNKGVGLRQNEYTVIDSNLIKDNSIGGIITLEQTYFGRIMNNTISMNGFGIGYVSDGHGWINTTIVGNKIFDNYGLGISFVGYHSQGVDNTIISNQINNNRGGISLAIGCSGNLIYDNNVTSNQGSGINFEGGPSNNEVVGNNIEFNTAGIYLGPGVFWWEPYPEFNNLIADNSIENNEYFGLKLLANGKNVIEENFFKNNSDAIILDYLNNPDYPESSDTPGFYSTKNVITKNTIVTNSYGFKIFNCSNNRIFGNNVLNNINQVYSDLSVNRWDDGFSSGNYWSDHIVADSNNDGVGDVPYVMDDYNIDYYPLFRPLSQPSLGYLVVQGMDNLIYDATLDFSKMTFSSWRPLPGSTDDSPGAVVCGNQLHMVVRGLSGDSLYHGYIDLADGVFKGWSWISGATLSSPTLSSNGTAITLTVRGNDNRIYYRVYTMASQTWSDWQTLASGLTCDAVSALMYDSELLIVVRGYSPVDINGNNTLWQTVINLDTGDYSDWALIPGLVTSSPALAGWGNEDDYCLIVRGGDNRIYINKYIDFYWAGWMVLSSGLTSESPAAAIIDNRLHLVTVGLDKTALWQSVLNLDSEAFSGWVRIAGATPSKPVILL